MFYNQELTPILHKAGLYPEALLHSRRALALRETHADPDDPTIAAALNNLAVLYDETGRHAEAEPLFKRALQIDEAKLGPDHPLVAIRLNNMAMQYMATGRYAEAEPLLKRALKIDEAKFGPDHPNVAGLIFHRTQVQAQSLHMGRRCRAVDGGSYVRRVRASSPVGPETRVHLPVLILISAKPIITIQPCGRIIWIMNLSIALAGMLWLVAACAEDPRIPIGGPEGATHQQVRNDHYECARENQAPAVFTRPSPAREASRAGTVRARHRMYIMCMEARGYRYRP